VTLLAFAAGRWPCSKRSISPGRRAHSTKPAAAAAGARTDGHTLDSFIDPALHTAETVNTHKSGLTIVSTVPRHGAPRANPAPGLDAFWHRRWPTALRYSPVVNLCSMLLLNLFCMTRKCTDCVIYSS